MMDKQKALNILGLDESASKDDIKKKFKKLAKEKHPDINKTEGAEEEYKQISAAFEYLKNPPPEPVFQPSGGFRGGGFWNSISDFFNQQHVTQQHVVRKPLPKPIMTSIKISFKEAVLGCKKPIKINRGLKCSVCDGDGHKSNSPECSTCSGQGQVARNNGNFTFVTTCPDCFGGGKYLEDCEACIGKGYQESKSDLTITIKPGILNGQIMRLSGGGHYFKNMGHDSYGEARVKVLVESEPNMRISGQNVISTLEISLLEALRGGSKEVVTIMGISAVTIPAKTKHKDQIKIKNRGVARKGDHIFNIDVVYPQETDKIIELLENKDV